MIRLSELNQLIQFSIENSFRGKTFDVIAEIGQVNIKTEKRQAFFELVEKGDSPGTFRARLSANLWRRFEIIEEFEKLTGQTLNKGMEILLKVSIQFHPTFGLSAEVIQIDPQYTLGSLLLSKEKAILQLLQKYPDKLQRVNGRLHSLNQTHRIPEVIQNIALITAQQAEGGLDFLHELQNNRWNYQWNIVPFFATMQGEHAALSIRESIKQIFQSEINFDVIAIVRGGGASLDLHAFDQFTLAEAIIRCPIPIYTGIGHTSNVSLADEVAHSFFKSPTKVAEELIHHNRNFEEKITNLGRTISGMCEQKCKSSFEMLRMLSLQFSVEPYNIIRGHLEQLSNYQIKLEGKTIQLINQKRNNLNHCFIPIQHASSQKLKWAKKQLAPLIDQIVLETNRSLLHKKEKLSWIQQSIQSKDPKRWIEKGYARIISQNKILTSIHQVSSGDTISIEMKDGIIQTQIKSIQPHE
jgi:exodeoxyribonuclease VII large subunit